jgi:hypothetical protein
MANLRAGATDGPWRKFDYGACAQAKRNPVGGKSLHYFHDARSAVQVDQVDVIAHAHGVHRFTGHDPNALLRSQCRMGKQAAATLCRCIGNRDNCGDNGAT